MAKNVPPAPPYRWYPLGTESTSRPEVGQVVAWHHQAWRVIESAMVPEIDWTDADRKRVEAYKPEFRLANVPWRIIARPVSITADDPRSRDYDVHLSVPAGAFRPFEVYPSGHYPVCCQCGEPVPCREEMARTIGERAEADAAKYEISGVCPSCQEIPTARHKVITFEQNLRVPLGPPVTFHTGRRSCRIDAAKYEREIAKTDPAYRMVLNCPGTRLTHNYGANGSECSEGADCMGDRFPHVARNWCNMCQLCQDAIAGREANIAARHAAGDWTVW